MHTIDSVLLEMQSITDQALASGSFDPSKVSEAIKNYLSICGEIVYTNPETIQRAKRVMGRAIVVHAYLSSPVYTPSIRREWLDSERCLDLTSGAFEIDKSALSDKTSWYVDDYASFDNRTSGSTGAPFGYRVWKDVYETVERDRHYKMILDEFGIKNPNVLYMESYLPVKYQEFKSGMLTMKVAKKEDFSNEFASLVCSHGKDGDYSHICFDKQAFIHVYDYFRFVLSYIQKNKINVLMSSGGFFELFTTYLISDDAPNLPKLVDLVSNTGDRANVETLKFLQETEITKNWCDHMRCWDGGASFFTCPYGTYHLQEELSHVFTDENGRLCSVDFLSYPSPFVNYFNGDYCSVGSDYRKCDCGRWYREFQFHNRKPRQYSNSVGGYYDTEQVISMLLDRFKVRFFSFQDGSVSIEETGLTDDDKRGIVEEMAKIYVMVNFFNNATLSAFSVIPVPNSYCQNACGDNNDYCAWIGVKQGYQCISNPQPDPGEGGE